MKKIIERTKFAIAWQKTNKDQDRDEHDGQVRPNWRYGYYPYQVPSWMNAWLLKCEQTHGLQRLSSVIRILSAHKVYLSTLHIGSGFGADYQKILGLLDLFCGTPRSLKLLAWFPEKNCITEKLSEFCRLYEGDKEHLNGLVFKGYGSILGRTVWICGNERGRRDKEHFLFNVLLHTG